MEEYIIRITKNPEERRKELIDIAERLFIKKGYEQTAVSDIVKKAKVAQGTFYYSPSRYILKRFYGYH